MAVALGTTLINKNVSTLLLYGEWKWKEAFTTNGTDIFIGCIVNRRGQSNDDIDPAEQDEDPFGIVLGYAPPDVDDSEDPFYRDYDNPFADGKKVLVGKPTSGSTTLVLSDTNVSIAIGDLLMLATTGTVRIGDTGGQIIGSAYSAVTAAANTRKWLYMTWK